MIKVLMFGWEFPPHISGGLGTVCYGLTHGLIANGVEVLFVLPRVFGDEDEGNVKFVSAGDVLLGDEKLMKQLSERITFIGINSSLTPYISEDEYERRKEWQKWQKEAKEGKNYPFAGGYGWNLREEVYRYGKVAGKIASQLEFNVIHVHDWLTFPAGIEAKKVSGKPLVAHVHATEFDRSGENINQEIYEIEKAGMQAADRVIAVSQFTRKIIIDRYGIDGRKVTVIHNAVLQNDLPVHEGPKKGFNEKVVTFLGRVTFQKGPDYFVEVARKVLKHNKNVRFVMAGSGNMLNEMIKRVAANKLSKRFHFAGFLKDGEVDDMLAQTDVYVMPSVSEPFGVSALEAIQHNVPVVISKQSGVSEVLTHAVKIDFWDTDKMADTINGLLQYNGLARKLGDNSRSEITHLTWENQASKVKHVYESLN